MQEAGFNPDLTRAQRAVEKLIHDLDWGRFHSPSRLARSILLEAAELQQEVAWRSEGEADALFRDRDGREPLVAELADIVINLLALAGEIDVDLNEAVEAKAAELHDRYAVEGDRRGRARHELS